MNQRRVGRWGTLGVVIALLLPMLSTLGSCAPDAQAGSASRPTRIEFWTLALSPFRTYIERSISTFEAENPGVRVVWVDLPFEAADRKLIAAAAAGRAPDVINLSDRSFGRYVGLGAMADMTPHLPGDPAAVYFPGVLSLGRLGGRTLALPWYLTTQVGMMNTSVLAEGGLTPETLGRDWATLRSQAGAFHAKTGKYLFSQPLGQESQLPIMMMADGLQMLRESRSDPRRLESNLLDPAIVAFVRVWVELYRSGAMPAEAATRDHGHLTDMYQNGELATVDTGPNLLSRIKQSAPGVYGATTLRGPLAGSLGRAHIATMVVGVTTQSKHKDIATTFAWFITSPERQAEFCAIAPILPSTPRTLQESPVFQELAKDREAGTGDKDARGRAIAAAALPNGVAFTPALEVWPDLRRAFEEGVQRALLSGADVEKTLRTIDAEWNRVLASAPPAGMEAVPSATQAEVRTIEAAKEYAPR